ncbi:CopD family protein [Sagittula sp. S175]|uniref:CopD family protein n=1 Tax=Sagittula sp. S175 TaxID=3415129 RepID=UPI003C7A5F45
MAWVKIIHILCVMGWMTSIFAVPRAIIYWKRDFAKTGENGPLGDLTYRLYRFSFGLGIIAIVTGAWYGTWLGWPAWLHLKVALVILLAAHYLYTGKLVKRAQRGEFRESDMFLRIFNEVSVFGAIAILWVVVVKPF